MSQVTLKSVFGVEEVGDSVKKFNFDADERGLTIPFAPLYEPLNKKTFQQLKSEDQILIAAVAKSMQRLQQGDRNFDSVLAIFMQNPLVQPDNEKTIIRSDTYHTEAREFAKFDGSPDAEVVKKVQHWFAQLVKDDEVLRTVGAGADAVAKVVASSGATVTDFESAIHKEEKHEKVFDVTFLNFPDPVEPFFKLQNVRLRAWSQSDRTGLVQTDQNGITGDYRVRTFTYRADVLSTLSDGARSKALEFAKGLFE